MVERNPAARFRYDPATKTIVVHADQNHQNELHITSAFLREHFPTTSENMPRNPNIRKRIKERFNECLVDIVNKRAGATLYLQLYWLTIMHRKPPGNDMGHNDYKNRLLNHWDARDFRALIKECGVDWEQQQDQVHVYPQQTAEQLAHKVEHLVQTGYTSKATRIATSDGIATPGNQENLDRVKAKFPDRQYDISDRNNPDVQPIQLKDDDELWSYIVRLNRFAAPGVDGFRAGHLKALAEVGDAAYSFMRNYRTFINMVLRGDLDEETKDFIMTNNMVTLYKDSSREDIRPIAISTLHRRLASIIVLDNLQKEIDTTFDQFYFGGRRAGSETMVHSIHALAEQFSESNEPHWIMHLDAKNAYGLANREVILRGFHENFGKAYQYAKMCYTSDATMMYGTDGFVSNNGVLQGDPLSTMAFNFVVRELRRSIEPIMGRCQFFSYVDDIVLAGPADDVIAVYQNILENGRAVGYQLQPHKCHLSQPNKNIAFPERHRNLTGVIKGVTTDAQGVIKVDQTQSTLNVPMQLKCQSDEEKRTAIRPIIDDMLTKIGKMNWSVLNKHIAYTIQRLCLSECLLTFHLRVIPPPLWYDLLEGFDQRVLEVFRDIVGLDDAVYDAATLKRIRLPIRDNGMGLRASHEHAPAAFLGSLLATKTAVLAVLGNDNAIATAHIDSLLEATTAQWMQAAHTATLPNEPDQHKLSIAIDEHKRTTLKQELDDPRNKSRINGFEASHGGCFGVIPVYGGIKRFTNTEFQGAVAAYLQHGHSTRCTRGQRTRHALCLWLWDVH